MKYQDFSSNENFVSGEDTIFYLFKDDDYFSLSQWETTIVASHYLHVFRDKYVAFSFEISRLMAVKFGIQINATYFLYFRQYVRFFYLLNVD